MSDGENILFQQRKIQVRPGEMESVCLKKEKLADLSEGICISVVGV